MFFNYPHYCLNRLENQIGVPVYEYCFSKSNGRLSSWHSGELIYVYGNIPDGSPLFDENDRALSKLFGQYVKNFAVTGDPNGDGLPVWEISADSRRLMGLGDTVGMMNEKYLALYDVFDRMQGWGD